MVKILSEEKRKKIKNLSSILVFNWYNPYKVVNAKNKEYFSNGSKILGVKIKANKRSAFVFL